MISQDFKEFVIVGAVMTLVLLPVRLLFVEFVNSSTLGSLGIVSLISIVILVLVKKKKLGTFGQMFERQMFRLTKGKRRIFVLTMLSITLIYFSTSLIAIEQGNTLYFTEKESIKAELEDNYNIDFSDTESVKKVLEPEKIATGFPEYFDSLFSNFKAIAIVQAIINDYSQGMIQHFHLVFLIEEIEILGIFIFYSTQFRKKEVNAEN